MEPSFVATRPHPRGMWKHPGVPARALHQPLHEILPTPPGKREWRGGKTEGYGHLRFGRFTKAGANSCDFTTLHSSENPRSSYLYYTLHVHVYFHMIFTNSCSNSRKWPGLHSPSPPGLVSLLASQFRKPTK